MRRHARWGITGTLSLGLVAGLTVWGSASSAPAPSPRPSATRCGDVIQHPWCNITLSPAIRAQLLNAAMSTSDKITLLTGGVIPDVGIPAIKFTDGALGIRGGQANATSATALPAATALAANFNPFNAYLYGTVVGRDAKALGYDGVWGPTVNLMRTPLGGRTFEAYGEDPFLSSGTAVGWVRGLQNQGVMADVKHYIANDQEGYLGVPLLTGTLGGRVYVNAVVDTRTLHELYLMPFQAAVQQGNSATVMCSYNKINGTYACENAQLLQQVLEKELGFNGYVVSDAAAAHNTGANLNNGLDFDIASTGYQAQEVELALATGQVSMATLDEHVLRILQTLFAFGFFDRPYYAANEANLNQPSDDALAQWIEEQGITLLQNNDHVLPFDPTKLSSVAVIGSTATTYTRGSGSSEVTPTRIINPLAAIRARAGHGVAVTYNDGLLPSQAAAVAAKASAAIVFVHDSEIEGSDKLCMSLDCPSFGAPDLNNLSGTQLTVGLQDQLIESVAKANPNTIVVLETGGPVLTPWRNLVKGVVEAWYPGQEGGTAIARVLFGDTDPGGRLPVTFPASPVQEPTAGNLGAYPGPINVTYSEGVNLGYRWFNAHNYTPAYAFGAGLSYTTFDYHDLHITPALPSTNTTGTNQTTATVTVDVTNTGTRAGQAVPELYLALPSQPNTPQPPQQLKGYQKVELASGQTARITFHLNDRSFAYWDTPANRWSIAPGCYGVSIGPSSADLPLAGSIARLGANCGWGAVMVTAPDHSGTSQVVPEAPSVTYSR